MRKENKEFMTELAVQKPYAGEEPHIFISYAHRSRAEVLPVIARMQKDGYRVWYDEGIDPGTEWDENIAVHVEKCTVFLAFMAQEYLDSDNCRDELNYARDLKKNLLLIYLQDVKLPSGMALRLNRLQAIHKYTYADEEAFYEKLYSAPEPAVCRGQAPDDLKQLCADFVNRKAGYEFVQLLTYDYHERARFRTEVMQSLPAGTDCVCTSAEQFVNELIVSIQQGSSAAFREKYDAADYLILEDFENLAGKAATQEEIHRILRERFYAKKTTLLLNGKPIDNRFNDDLSALVRCAKTVRIERKSAVPEETVSVDPFMRILEDASEIFGVTKEEILGTSRRKDVREARCAVISAVRAVTDLSLAEIGNRLGRDPSTVAANLNKFDEMNVSDLNFALRAGILLRKNQKQES